MCVFFFSFLHFIRCRWSRSPFPETQDSHRGPPAQEAHGFPWGRSLGGHHERTRRVLGFKRGVVRARHPRLGQIRSWRKLRLVDWTNLYNYESAFPPLPVCEIKEGSYWV